MHWPEVFGDLSILAAHIAIGAIIHEKQPNYAVLSRAAATIKTVLNRTWSERLSYSSQGSRIQGALDVDGDLGDWDLWSVQGGWGLEQDFWSDLGIPNSALGRARQKVDRLQTETRLTGTVLGPITIVL